MELDKYKLNLPFFNLLSLHDTFTWQAIVAEISEEIEYYAMYDPIIINAIFYLIIFKAIEYLGKLGFNSLKSSLTLEEKQLKRYWNIMVALKKARNWNNFWVYLLAYPS